MTGVPNAVREDRWPGHRTTVATGGAPAPATTPTPPTPRPARPATGTGARPNPSLTRSE